jgi:hypothetical protein
MEVEISEIKNLLAEIERKIYTNSLESFKASVMLEIENTSFLKIDKFEKFIEILNICDEKEETFCNALNIDFNNIDIQVKDHELVEDDDFYNKFRQIFDRALKLDEKLSHIDGKLCNNQLQINQWMFKFSFYPKSAKSN